jgi:hypothetical protein
MSRNHDVDLERYLQVLTDGAQTGQLLELRYRPIRGRMCQRFVPARSMARAVRLIEAFARTADVYIGVALRDGPRGDKSSISRARLLHIESDDLSTHQRLVGFTWPPSMIVTSGSAGHLHLYWQLTCPAAPAQVEHANRRLAAALAGERGCCDVSRVLRPPATLNHKHTPPRPVTLLACQHAARYELSELLAGLPADPEPRRPASGGRSTVRPRARTELDRRLLAIPAPEYVRVLSGREPDRTGKVLCPFHEEKEPSLHLYPDGTFFCFGASCRKGGSIFDFAAHLWGTGTRAKDFTALRARLARTFGLSTPPRR